MNDFDKNRAIGRTGEIMVSECLKAQGWFIIPSYDYTGEDGNKAPRLQGLLESHTLPDLDISKAGTRLWAEVKTKADATYTRFLQRREHGISLRHYTDYLKVQDRTGCSVWLFIYEQSSREVVFEELSRLALVRREYVGDKMGSDGMVFFPRDQFVIWPLASFDGDSEDPVLAAEKRRQERAAVKSPLAASIFPPKKPEVQQFSLWGAE